MCPINYSYPVLSRSFRRRISNSIVIISASCIIVTVHVKIIIMVINKDESIAWRGIIYADFHPETLAPSVFLMTSQNTMPPGPLKALTISCLVEQCRYLSLFQRSPWMCFTLHYSQLTIILSFFVEWGSHSWDYFSESVWFTPGVLFDT